MMVKISNVDSMKPRSLRILLFREAGEWIAQGLEVDLCAHGPTQEAALQTLRATLALQLRLDRRASREPFSKSRRAEEHLFRLFENAIPWSPAVSEGTVRPSSDAFPQIAEIRAAA